MEPRDQLDATPKIETEHAPPPTEDEVVQPILWHYVFVFVLLHIGAVIGLFLVPHAKLATVLFAVLLYFIGGLGVTAGVHRLWSHRSYKARLPLRAMLMVFNLTVGQDSIIQWSKNHRVHHKFTETNADAHNAKRGFFYAQIGWAMYKHHPDYIAKEKQLDVSDLFNDPLVNFQHRYYAPLALVMCFIMPTVVPWLIWDENIVISYFISGVLRYIVILNVTGLVNSAAHLWGRKPYDRHINPSENLLVSLGAMGEGFHNYHHTFPQDYSTSEFGMTLNTTTMFINLMAKIGWAYDLKKTPKEVIEARKRRTGCLSSESTGEPAKSQ